MCIKMSDVRLSNASPTLERVDARQLDNLRPSVRRCLFGSPDPEELRELFEASRQEEASRFRDAYNFDPVEERPLSPGKFKWEEWKDAPEFYRRAPHKRLKQSRSKRKLAETEEQTASTERPRKRPSGASGSSCGSAPQSKSSRSDGEYEQEADDGTGQAAQVSEQTSPLQ